MTRSSTRRGRAAVGGVAVALAGGLLTVASPSYAASLGRLAALPSSTTSITRPQLLAVAALTPADAWAVGSRIEHWDGHRWRLQPGPKTGTCTATLHGVAVVARSNAWAVGGCASHAIIEHWNGRKWTVQSSRNPGSDPILFGVTAASAKSAWAVGTYVTSTSAELTLIEHWNGHRWGVQSSFSPGSLGNTLSAAAAARGTTAWAVGTYGYSSGDSTLIEGWNGSGWSVQSSESPAAYNAFNGIVATSASTALAVGFTATESSRTHSSSAGTEVPGRW